MKRYIKVLVRKALEEDIGKGDITTENLFPKDRNVKAFLLAKEEMVLAGSQVFEEVFRSFRKKIHFRWLMYDGNSVKKNSKICEIEGSLKTLLKGERVALNFLQRLSGIATLTSLFVKRTKSKKIHITDTRKTTPLLRKLEKYAVSVGGGFNHRMGLSDMVLIKDNHIKAFGSIIRTLKFLNTKGKFKVIEVETKSLKEVREALKGNADIIMLDNMSFKEMKKAIEIISRRAKIEISGGVELSNISNLSKLDVDYISIGALTHSPRSVDISLEIQ